MTLRNIPDELFSVIRENAQKNRRSLNQQVLIYLERACLDLNRPEDIERDLEEIAKLRSQGKSLSVAEIQAAIDERL